MLLKDLGARFGGGGTTAAGAAVVRAQIASSFGIHPQLNDGSGLSRCDRTTPRQVVTLLRAAWPATPPFINSLAVAGETGHAAATRCAARSPRAAAAARPGTLHDVANLVGYCHGRATATRSRSRS